MSTQELSKVLKLRGITDQEFRALVILTESASGSYVEIPDEVLAERLETTPNEARSIVIGMCEKGTIRPLAWGWVQDWKTGKNLLGFMGQLHFFDAKAGGSNGL